MIFAEMEYQDDYWNFHAELLAYVAAHFPHVMSGLQGDSWIWIIDGDEKVSIDTFSSMKHQIRSEKAGQHVRKVIDTLLLKYALKVYEHPEFEGHEDVQVYRTSAQAAAEPGKERGATREYSGATRFGNSSDPYAMTTTIRPETPSDEDAIEQVTRRAFLSHPYSHQTEHFIIRALRAAHALSLSLVAEETGRVVGHIAFSPVSIADGAAGWYGLGPVSVEPDRQGRGIGRALMEAGLAELRAIGANGCLLVGDPAFYTRFGFANDPALVLDGVPPEFFLALAFGASRARGKVSFHDAFDAKG